jgi:hypothetical protein
MHQTYKILKLYFANIGGLEYFGACLSGKGKADGQGTQAAPRR